MFQSNPAECLIDLAAIVMSGRDEVDLYDDVDVLFGNVNVTIARVDIAIKFIRKSKAFQLRALIEEWDMQRIVREMY